MFSYLMQPIAHSTLMNSHTFNIRLNTHRLPSTVSMVEEATLTLDSTRGISLQRLKKYISEKYQIDVTARRYSLIKEHLRAQLAIGALRNVSGRGLSGSFRLQAKKKNAIASDSRDLLAANTLPVAGKKRRGNGGGGNGGSIADEHTVANKRNKATGKKKSEPSKSGKSKGRNQQINATTLARTPPNCAPLAMAPFAPHRNSLAAAMSHVNQGSSTPLSAGERVGRKRKLLPATESQGF
ncbi:histone H1, gonadal-like [Anastrepha obliqua]|uniref:histone H1, gonadal-like n=1 Tax=Anastrepha obliqua TaxID=95512 RepID=UPI00240A925C|nr:histone H1, gonadal-like [Anastrepha obliqua]